MVTCAGTLKETLREWTDVDVAQYSVAAVLGLIDPAISPFATRAKHVFWTDNPVGNVLYELLQTLVSLGVLERREDPDIQYRWNAAYRGTWE
ncbi:MAG TPA: hypothetical protein VE093_39485 [Polyangiaceae bacterium]|jgi:hypothetical protein|nr:hypothetical protein [Polyangiaceae bacterium]